MPKLKTKKTAAKRLKKNKRKILREVRGISHLRTKKSSSQKKRQKGKRELDPTDVKKFKQMVPGLK